MLFSSAAGPTMDAVVTSFVGTTLTLDAFPCGLRIGRLLGEGGFAYVFQVRTHFGRSDTIPSHALRPQTLAALLQKARRAHHGLSCIFSLMAALVACCLSPAAVSFGKQHQHIGEQKFFLQATCLASNRELCLKRMVIGTDPRVERVVKTEVELLQRLKGRPEIVGFVAAEVRVVRGLVRGEMGDVVVARATAPPPHVLTTLHLRFHSLGTNEANHNPVPPLRMRHTHR